MNLCEYCGQSTEGRYCDDDCRRADKTGTGPMAGIDGFCPRKVAGWIQTTAEFHRECAEASAHLDSVFDRWLRPWRHPDPNPMPRLVLFPRLARLHRRLR